LTASIGVDGSTFNGWTESPPTESFPVREEPPLKQGATSPYVSGVPSPPHFPTNGSNNASMTGKFGPSPSRDVHAGLWERNMFHTYFERRRFTRSTSASVHISDGVCTLMSPMNVVSSLVMTSILRSVHVGWDVMRSRRNNAPIRRSVASSFSSSRAAPRSVNVCLARIAPPGMRVGAEGAVSASGPSPRWSSHGLLPAGISDTPPFSSASPTLAFFGSGPPLTSIARKEVGAKQNLVLAKSVGISYFEYPVQQGIQLEGIRN